MKFVMQLSNGCKFGRFYQYIGNIGNLKQYTIFPQFLLIPVLTDLFPNFLYTTQIREEKQTSDK